MINRVCQQCENDFFVIPSKIKQGRGKFCSVMCRAEYKKGKPSGRMSGGWKLSEETRKKMSISRTREKNYFFGKKLTKEHREKLRKAKIGTHRSEETKIKIGLANTGERSTFWRGGKMKYYEVNIQIRKSSEYNQWRNAVFIRDHYHCTACGLKSGNGKAVFLEADHIKPFAIFPKLRFVLDNGKTLCKECHKNTDTYGRKVYKLTKGILSCLP